MSAENKEGSIQTTNPSRPQPKIKITKSATRSRMLSVNPMWQLWTQTLQIRQMPSVRTNLSPTVCKKPNHFAQVCRSKGRRSQIHPINKEENDPTKSKFESITFESITIANIANQLGKGNQG